MPFPLSLQKQILLGFLLLPWTTYGESVTLAGKTEVFSLENPSVLQGYFNPGSKVEVEEFVTASKMYRVRFKLPNNKEIVALCKPADLGKSSSGKGAVEEMRTGMTMESFENFNIKMDKGTAKTGSGSWLFCRGSGTDANGRTTIVDKKGMDKSHAILIEPDGDQGYMVFAALKVAALDRQEVGFWIRRDGEAPLALVLLIKSDKGKELARILLGGHEGEHLPMEPDVTGWTHVTLKFDTAKSEMTAVEGTSLRGGAKLILPLLSEAAGGFYMIQWLCNYSKSKHREGILLDNISFLE